MVLPPVAGAEVPAAPVVPVLTAISDGDDDEVGDVVTPVLALVLSLALPSPAPVLVAPWPAPTLAEAPVFVSVPIDAWCDVAVTDVPDVVQLAPVEAPALESCPLNAIAVPAPANANAVTEANMVVRNDDIGSSLMGSGSSEPFTPFIARQPPTVTKFFRFSGFSKEAPGQWIRTIHVVAVDDWRAVGAGSARQSQQR
jgi:hypothetical protein